MKHRLLIILLAIVAVGCVKDRTTSPVETPQSEAVRLKHIGDLTANYREGSLLIYFDEDTTDALREGNDDAVSHIFDGVALNSLEPAIRHTPKNEALARELGLHRWFVAQFDSLHSVDDVIALVAPHAEVCAVEYNTLSSLASDCVATPYHAATPTAQPLASELGFNDSMNELQWNLYNTGSQVIARTAREGADVGVKDAWRLTAGSPDVIVAVCDAPIKYTHPDLKDAMWTNAAELNGAEGVDDDGNGFVDDIHGYNFCSEGYSNGAINWLVDGESGHGTHVAGIIAATNNNSIGVSSIAGGSGSGDGVRLMSCQIFEGSVSAGNREIAEAFTYAADNGACIAQCSYGYDASFYANDNAYINASTLEYRAIKYFIAPENANHPALDANIAIFAAGNEAASNSDYPGALPICISVTAFGPDFLPGFYTNYGRGCNIAAPGGDKLQAQDGRYDYAQILSTCISEVAGDYAWMSGTSMACPHVSGVAALGISYAGKLGKRFTADEFKAMLLTSVNDINSLLTGTKEYPSDGVSLDLKSYYKRMGTGAIDAWRLMMQIEGTPSIMVRQGEQSMVSLDEYFGESSEDLTYLDITYDDDAKAVLGITTKPKIKDGMLNIKCNNLGSAKVKISAIAGGGQLGGGNNIGGTEIVKEVSIISRGVTTTNGGWF